MEPCGWCPAPGICSRWKRPGECGRHREQRERAGLAPATTVVTPEQREKVRRWREIITRIHVCPYKLPKDPEAPGECGCIGRCDAGKGDLPEGRTSYRNCERCQSGDIG